MKAKKLLAMILSLTMILGLCTVGAKAEAGNVASVTIGETTTEYATLQEAMNAATGSSEDTIVTLLCDITDNGSYVTAHLNPSNPASLKINGDNHSISGLSQSLISGLASGNVEIVDLTIKDSNINQGEMNGLGRGAFVSYIDTGSGTLTMTNCHVQNCTIDAGANDAGALFGYSSANAPIIIQGCSVEGCIFAGALSGAIGGYGPYGNLTVTDTTVTGNKLYGETNVKVGILFGYSGAVGGSTYSFNATESNNELYVGNLSESTPLTGEAVHEVARNVNGTTVFTKGGSYTVNPTIYEQYPNTTGPLGPQTGYEALQLEDNTWTIAGPVAIGDTYYSSLPEAIAAAEAGDTITLIKDITATAALLVPPGKDFTIEGADHTITFDGSTLTDNALFYGSATNNAFNNASLTIKNTKIVDSSAATSKVVTTLSGAENANITLIGCTLDNLWSAAYLNNGTGSLTVKNCLYKNCGGGLWSAGPNDNFDVTIQGSRFDGTTMEVMASGNLNIVGNDFSKVETIAVRDGDGPIALNGNYWKDGAEPEFELADGSGAVAEIESWYDLINESETAPATGVAFTLSKPAVLDTTAESLEVKDEATGVEVVIDTSAGSAMKDIFDDAAAEVGTVVRTVVDGDNTTTTTVTDVDLTVLIEDKSTGVPTEGFAVYENDKIVAVFDISIQKTTTTETVTKNTETGDKVGETTVDTSTETVAYTGGSTKVSFPYRVSEVTVSTASGRQVEVSRGVDGSYLFTMPDEDVAINCEFVESIASLDKTHVDRLLNTDDHILYIIGYDDGLIHPLNNITRAETAMMLYRLLRQPQVEKTVSFSDVEEGRWFSEAVLTLASLGIINGSPEGTFVPMQAITHAEFTAMAVRFANPAEGIYRYTDVSESYWAGQAIATASAYGWIQGYGDGSFRPQQPINRAEAATVLNAMLNRSADKAYIAEHFDELNRFDDLRDSARWYFYAMVEASNAHDYHRDDGVEVWDGNKRVK